MRLRVSVGVLVALVLIQACQAQESRYELGRRLRVMERAWDKQKNLAIRASASQGLDLAVRSFFHFDLPESARAMDEAALRLRDGKEPTTTERWVAALEARPATRLLDAADSSLKVTIGASYQCERPIIDRIDVHVSFLSDNSGEAQAKPTALKVPTDEFPTVMELPLAGVGTGDHGLHVAFYAGSRLVGRLEVGISRVERLRPRLDDAARQIAEWAPASESNPTERATARGLLEQLHALAEGKTLETDVPGARRLGDLEAILAAESTGKLFWGSGRTGDYWVALATGEPRGRSTPARLLLPKRLNGDTPLPLVVALHGAGGSENMFFDSYGAGSIVTHCQERGWLLVAPRVSGLSRLAVPQIVDAVLKIHPVDAKRVFVIGHSIGAELGVSAVARNPNQFAAIAALGGGGPLSGASDEIKKLPFFIGVGSNDLTLSGARSLKKSLELAGVKRVEYQEYADVEHLAIVSVALPSVFQFFDEIAAGQ